MSGAGVKPPHIVIAGAGLIGCFCGGLWAAAGYPVTLLGRRRVLSPIAQAGLAVTDFAGLNKRVGAGQVHCSEDPGVLAGADLVIVAVKTSATAAMGQQIALHAPPSAPVFSFQNGMGNATLLQQMLPGRDVRAAMVPFNVVPPDMHPPLSQDADDHDGALTGQQGASFTPAGFHRASSGDIVIAAGPGHWGRRLSVPGLAVVESADIAAVQWGKLLINLNNALNALSGGPIIAQLPSHQWRRLMADQMAEALRVMQAAGLRPVSTTPLPVWMGPHILRLPTWAFSRIAAQMLTIDPTALSSMAQDLMQGRVTEVDVLQGEIQRLGQAHGVATPICDVVMQLIRQAEMKKAGLPNMQPGQI
jgi:2-dehydropantoate 2-reductase